MRLSPGLFRNEGDGKDFDSRLVIPVWLNRYIFKRIMKEIVCSWSGGKDSCFALMKALQTGVPSKSFIERIK
ncbi:MAG: hypothetical protein WDO71_22580 [Bacteroidota bacterium]